MLPPPLTPADCDLRGLPYMPLDVIRLLDSDMFAESTGEEFKAAVALWCKSWTQIPAASLPNKDKVLAKLSQSDNWKKVKDGAMRGWILCADDRWYHPVVAEKALAALPGREEFNNKKSSEAERKAREREDRKALFEILRGHGIVPDWNVSTKALRGMAAQYLSQEPPDNFRDESRDMSQQVTVSKGECKKKGEGELTSKALSGGATDSDREDGDERPPRKPGTTITPDTRAVAIATLLTGAGVKRVTAFHPDVATTWAQDERVTDELLLAAVAKAKESLGDESFQTAYLRPIVVELLNPPAQKAPKVDDWAWKRSNPGIEAKGRELGMFARAGESYADFAARIQIAIDKRKGGKP